jgi:hypothetical protein
MRTSESELTRNLKLGFDGDFRLCCCWGQEKIMRFFYMGSIAGLLLVAACLVNLPDPDAGFRCLSHDDCIDGDYFCDVRHQETDENGKQRGHCFAWVEHGCNGDCAGECIQDTLENTERCVESPQESGSGCATSSEPDGCAENALCLNDACGSLDSCDTSGGCGADEACVDIDSTGAFHCVEIADCDDGRNMGDFCSSQSWGINRHYGEGLCMRVVNVVQNHQEVCVICGPCEDGKVCGVPAFVAADYYAVGTCCATSSESDGCCNPGDANDPDCSQGGTGTAARGEDCDMEAACSGPMLCINTEANTLGGICTPTCGSMTSGGNCNYEGPTTGLCAEVSEHDTEVTQNVCVQCLNNDCTVCELKDATTVANTYEDALECQSSDGDCAEPCEPTEVCVVNPESSSNEFWCVTKNGQDCNADVDCASAYCNPADDRCWNDSGCSNSISCAQQNEVCVYGTCVALDSCNADGTCENVGENVALCVTNLNLQEVCVEAGVLTEASGSCAGTSFGQSCLATWGSEGHYGVCAAAPLAQNGGNTVACAPCPKCTEGNEVCGVSTTSTDVSSYKSVTCCADGIVVDECCNPEEIDTDPDCNQSGGGGGGDVHDAELDTCYNHESNCSAACMRTADAVANTAGCTAGCYCVPQFGPADNGITCDVGEVKGIVRSVKTWDNQTGYVCAPCPPGCDSAGDNCICGPTDCNAGGASLDNSTQCL